MFDTIKLIHIGAATVSISLFVLRGLWMLAESPRLAQRWVRVVPHVNDSVLLAAGVGLAILSRQSPTDSAWLAAKITALVVYIALGMLALKPWLSKRSRTAAWLLALVVFAYMLAVARTRAPIPFWSDEL